MEVKAYKNLKVGFEKSKSTYTLIAVSHIFWGDEKLTPYRELTTDQSNNTTMSNLLNQIEVT